MIFFFFQAEDGIRDYKVTGVQTCALPISGPPIFGAVGRGVTGLLRSGISSLLIAAYPSCISTKISDETLIPPRSEEHTSELQSPCNLVCRLLLEKKKRDRYLLSHYSVCYL